MDIKRPGSGIFQNDVYKDLLQAMRMDDENKFNQILTSENVNVNKIYDKGADYGTLLDLCCLEENKSKYVTALLNRGANPNLLNNRTKKAPIHQAALHGDVDCMNAILNTEETDPNLLDNFGSTALHYACKNNDISMVQAILRKDDTNLNIINRKGKSPLQLILDKEPSSEYLDVIKTLLAQPKLDLTLTNFEGLTLTQMIEESYPELADGEATIGNNFKSELDVGQLFLLLRRSSNYAQFLNKIKGNRDILEGNDGSFTFLQYCCECGIDEVVQALLDEGVNPNGTCTNNIWPPVMIACRKGFVSIVKMLVNCKKTSFEPVNNQTVFHCVVNGGYEQAALVENAIEKNHHECLMYILKKVPRGKIDINHRDNNGNTALHCAAKVGDQNIVLEILKAGAYIGVCNGINEPACADITHVTMERYLDSCIYTNGKMPRDETFAVVFDYSCLIPFSLNDRKAVSSSTEHFIEVPVAAFKDNFIHKKGETDPLIFMSKNSELRPLLTHPIFTSYLHLKWHKIQPYYFINLFFYFLFWIFLTYYILAVSIISSNDNKNLTSTDDVQHAGGQNTSYIIWTLVFFCLLLLILREVLQLVISPIKYIINPENWLEIGIITTTLLVLFCGSSNPLKHQISAIGILVSWAELVLLIGKHPSLSTNIEMLKTVSWNFLKFLAWYSILIVAFALCFYTLFKDAEEDDNQFQHPGIALFKTVVMLTGEFDSGSIPFLLYPVTSHILFVLFVFLIAIVLFNLLNGLAVSDTQAIKADAELVGYISQAKLISHIEEKLANKFDCWGILPKSFNFSNKINMFQDISEGTVKAYPNTGNRVELDDLGVTKIRKDDDSDGNCCYEMKSIYMDPRIIKASRQILYKREQDSVQKNYFDMLADKENDLKELMNGFKECLKEFKDITWRLNQSTQHKWE